MFGWLSRGISGAGATDCPASCANPDAAALKSMTAKKQLAAQTPALLIAQM
jgi:hypothetical protein